MKMPKRRADRSHRCWYVGSLPIISCQVITDFTVNFCLMHVTGFWPKSRVCFFFKEKQWISQTVCL